MKVELILPIAHLRGKLNGKSNFYFKTVNGKTYVQHCPRRTNQPLTPAQIAARERFADIAQRVRQLQQVLPKRPKKILWKIATEAYDAANR